MSRRLLAMLSALSCFDYQACETPDWRQSLAWQICDAIRDAAIRALPGYSSGPWEVRRPSPSPAPAPVAVAAPKPLSPAQKAARTRALRRGVA